MLQGAGPRSSPGFWLGSSPLVPLLSAELVEGEGEGERGARGWGCCQALPQPEPLPSGAHSPPSLVRSLSRFLPPLLPWGIFKTALLQFPPGRGCAAPGCAHTRSRAQRSRRLLNQEENRSAFFKARDQRLPDASEPRRAPARPAPPPPALQPGWIWGRGCSVFRNFLFFPGLGKSAKQTDKSFSATLFL